MENQWVLRLEDSQWAKWRGKAACQRKDVTQTLKSLESKFLYDHWSLVLLFYSVLWNIREKVGVTINSFLYPIRSSSFIHPTNDF